MDKETKSFYEFGPFRLDAAERRLTRNGQVISLTSKIFDILLILLQNSGHVIQKDELMRRVWPDAVVEENNLSKNISLLRKALGKSPQAPYIETVPKQGYRFAAGVHKSSGVSSIAVLPFKLLGAAQDDEYLGPGMADALITRLGNLQQIVVRPTHSILNYTGREPGLEAAGRELGVDFLLHGSIQKSGDRLRVTVQLVRVSDNVLIWAEPFDAGFTSLFSVEDAISEQVAQALMLKLSSAERERLTKHYTEDTEAYQLYLRGRYHWNKMTLADIAAAISYFERACERDRKYALAYAGLADSYCLMGFYTLLPSKETMPKAKAAAMQALQLDPTLAEAHTSLAAIKFEYDWDWSEARREFQRAIELNPDYATAHQWYSLYLMVTGRPDEAIAQIQCAQELDPLSPVMNAFMGWVLYFARRYDKAIEQCSTAISLDRDCTLAHFVLGLACTQNSMYAEAIAAFRKVIDLLAGLRLPIACIAHVYARLGKKSEALEMLNELTALSKQGFVIPYHIAIIHVGLGEKKKALQWLRKAYEARSSWLILLNVEPILDSLRSEPAFLTLQRRLQFPPPARATRPNR